MADGRMAGDHMADGRMARGPMADGHMAGDRGAVPAGPESARRGAPSHAPPGLPHPVSATSV